MRMKCFADLRRQKVGDVIKDRPSAEILAGVDYQSLIHTSHDSRGPDRDGAAICQCPPRTVPSRLARRAGTSRSSRLFLRSRAVAALVTNRLPGSASPYGATGRAGQRAIEVSLTAPWAAGPVSLAECQPRNTSTECEYRYR
jgi:hypothetical protein